MHEFTAVDNASYIVFLFCRGVLDPGAHVGQVLDGGLLSTDSDGTELMSPLSSSSQSPRRKELKARLRDAATPMLSMGRR